MNDSEFLALAEETFSRIEDAVEGKDCGFETLREGNVLTLEGDEGERVVLNIHTPTRQLWLASHTGGLHFEYKNGAWLSTRTNATLGESLNRMMSEVSGLPVDVSL